MNRIHLQQTLPQVFAGRDTVTSQIWHQNIVFSKGKRYLSRGCFRYRQIVFMQLYLWISSATIKVSSILMNSNIRSLSVNEWADIRKHSLSILFQELRIFPELTALENVLLKNRLNDYKKKKEIIALFEAIGIPDKINEKAGMLSFGQQQRVAFIRSLCQPFDFIFLDEPISHLDDENSAIMSQLLMEEAEKQGAGVIVTSIGKHSGTCHMTRLSGYNS